MFRTVFDKSLENATSHLLLEPEWPSIISICDTINQKDVTPKTAFAAIKKKMNSTNPHTAYYSLLVLESVVKNCGSPMHEEVFTKENCTMLSQYLEQTTHDNVRDKMLELVQTWAYAFRDSERYQAIKDTMTILKAKGHPFPELKEADAMFAMDTAPKWADGSKCHRCRDNFTMTNRKHHCRNCGQVFCGQCSSKSCPLPKFCIEKDVRVCDGCFAALQRPVTASAAKRPGETELPAEYLNSSLAQQVQTPPRKTEQELNEEEELQLALALSQSEAESKKQKQQPQTLAAYRLQQRSPSPEAPPAPKELQSAEETNPDLAKYLNRSYWEQRKISESPMASPSAPSPMPPTPQPQQGPQQLQQQQLQLEMAATDFRPKTTDEQKIDDFTSNMRMQVEIFVNRMKSNSSRGRSIANDSSVQTLFMTLTGLHSELLSFIKEHDDKRMWYEQLQDKLAQIKDSRAALDDLRTEHAEKLRRMAEEQELQRQIQMAQKLEIMRKKKQEYLQYQRQLALHRIQEQEREMQLRQEQQMAQYRMGQTAFPFMPAMAGMGPPGASAQPPHMAGISGMYNPYSPNGTTTAGMPHVGNMPPYNTTQAGASMSNALPGMYSHGGPQSLPQEPLPNTSQMPSMGGMMQPPTNQPQMLAMPGMMGPSAADPQLQQQQQQQLPHNPQMQPNNMAITNPQSMTTQPQPPQQQQPQAPTQMTHVMLQQQQHLMHSQSPIPNVGTHPTMANLSSPQMHNHLQQAQTQSQATPQHQPTMQAAPTNQPQPVPPQHLQQQQPQMPNPAPQAASQIQAVQSAPVPPQNDPEPAAPPAPEEPATAELISFD